MLDSKIPALSIREPYATLIVKGKKDIELRNWKPPEWIRDFYIHVPTVAYRQLCREYHIIPHPPRTIIGKARISGVKHYDTTDEFVRDYPRHHCKSCQYNYGFILSNVEEVEPDIGNIAGKRFFFFFFLANASWGSTTAAEVTSIRRDVPCWIKSFFDGIERMFSDMSIFLA